MPDVLDTVSGLAQQKRLQVAFHGRFHQVGALREGGAAVAVQAILVGKDLDHGEPHSGRLALDHLDILYLGSGHSVGCLGGRFLSALLARTGQSQQAGGADGLKHLATFHKRCSCGTSGKHTATPPASPGVPRGEVGRRGNRTPSWGRRRRAAASPISAPTWFDEPQEANGRVGWAKLFSSRCPRRLAGPGNQPAPRLPRFLGRRLRRRGQSLSEGGAVGPGWAVRRARRLRGG